MKRYLVFMMLCFPALCALAQLPAKPSVISIIIGDSLCEIRSVVTQTEFKPGWKIVDLKTRDKYTRYIWGKHSRQFADDRQPVFVVTPEPGRTLNDYAVIRLKEKKEFRRLPSTSLFECGFERIDLDNANIQLLADESYRVRFKQAFEPGEYILVDMKGEPKSEFGDVEVYPFTILR